MDSYGLHRTIRQQITDQIREDVLSGHWPEGTQLREKELAKRFGVSRGPIRDSLLQLTHEGLLVSKPNCGVTVRPALREHIQPLMVQLRRQIETFALQRLLQQRDGTLRELEQVCEQLRNACLQGDMSAVVKHDMALHRTIVQAGDKDDLVAVWQPIVMRMMLHYTRHKELMESYREHEAIVEAIRKCDLEAAIEALEANLQ